MFRTEEEMQGLVHDRPELVTSGIPEINPEFCPDTPQMVSLGREIPLASGPVDNLFVDTNAILTFVECKRYSDARIKREVYPQALNYASDLQAQLIHYDHEGFHEEFFKLVRAAQGNEFTNLASVIRSLSTDKVIDGKNTAEWQRQFPHRLERNIKNGICRVIILCAPAPNNAFAYRSIRNLMQLMAFSEQSGTKYDLMLMDLRELHGDYIAKIIWRRYAALPQIPLVAEYSRDTSAGIDAMKSREERLSSQAKETLNAILAELSTMGVMATENTHGYGLKWEKSKKSLYVQIQIQSGGLSVIRHQIRSGEELYSKLVSGNTPEALGELNYKVERKASSSIGDGVMFEIVITPTLSRDVGSLATTISDIAIR